MQGETISINGGPEIPVDQFTNGLKQIAASAGATPDEIRAHFQDRADREEAIKELRDEMKKGIDCFCASRGIDKKAFNMAYRLFKFLQKDRKDAEAMQFEYDKLAELLIEQPLS